MNAYTMILLQGHAALHIVCVIAGKGLDLFRKRIETISKRIELTGKRSELIKKRIEIIEKRVRFPGFRV